VTTATVVIHEAHLNLLA